MTEITQAELGAIEALFVQTTVPVSVFIDPMGCPLSPLPVAGVQRRERRRR